jgi:hypothetical protein
VGIPVGIPVDVPVDVDGPSGVRCGSGARSAGDDIDASRVGTDARGPVTGRWAAGCRFEVAGNEIDRPVNDTGACTGRTDIGGGGGIDPRNILGTGGGNGLSSNRAEPWSPPAARVDPDDPGSGVLDGPDVLSMLMSSCFQSVVPGGKVGGNVGDGVGGGGTEVGVTGLG